MGSPYYNLGEGIGSLIRGRSDQKRKEAVTQQAIDLNNQGEYKKLANLMIKHPELEEVITKVDGWTNTKVKDNAVDFSSKILLTEDPMELQRLVGQYMSKSIKLGGNTDESMPAAIALKNGDPEPLKNLAKGVLIKWDGKAYDRITKKEDEVGAVGESEKLTDNSKFVYFRKKEKEAATPEEKSYWGDQADNMQQIKRAGVAETYNVKSAEYRADLDYKAKVEADVAGRKKDVDHMTKLLDMVDKNTAHKENMYGVVRELRSGARTGPIENLFPSFRRSTLALQNIHNQLGLNVVQSATFGPLSDKELRFALSTALPPLDEKDLEAWALRKIDVMDKLEKQMTDMALFIQDGGRRADYVRIKRDEKEAKIKYTMEAEGMSRKQVLKAVKELKIRQGADIDRYMKMGRR